MDVIEINERRIAADPSITKEQISIFVDRFYSEIAKDPRLGPIFTSRNHNDWQPHLTKMKQFWRSVLLKSGEYKGQPPAVHMAITELESDDFTCWLSMFETVSEECFEPDAVLVVNEYAKRIARSLWLSCFGTPFDHPPF